MPEQKIKEQGAKRLRLRLDIPPSVNHCYINNYHRGRSRMLSPEAKCWKEYAALTAKAEARLQHWETPGRGQKVVVAIYAYWPDNRTRDMHNAHKLLMDALEDAGIYHNDKFALARDMDFSIDREEPRLELVIYLKPEVESLG